MDQKNLIDIWKRVLGEIETEISKANYLTLFKNTSLLSLEEENATIAASSSMVIDLIERRFLPIVKTSLDKHTKGDNKLIFVPRIVLSTPPSNTIDTPLFAQEIEEKPKYIPALTRVRPEYTFQNLAVSSSNQLAYISATTVAKNPGKSYNPLFIYGPVGVGKTHLMQAIANEVFHKDPTKKIIYITSEEFTNDVVEAIRTNQTNSMKKRFRSCSLLIIDDVQFIAGKDKVQEELFHTFNILIDNTAQIILSSDRPPHEIKKLEQRLSSRFSGGLTVDIEPPDFELKTAILLIKAKKYNVDLPIEAAKVLAESVEDTRSLEGILLRLITQAQATGSDITKELAEKVVGFMPREEKTTRVHPDDIIKHVCDFYNVKQTQIKGPKRDASLVRARQVAMYILKKELGLTLVEIGNYLGGRDHTTIMHGLEKVENLVTTKSPISADIVGITTSLRA